MKATGIVRRIDDLGRVVIPKEIRRTMRIREGDPLEIFTDREGTVILKKYSPIYELGSFAHEYTEALHRNLEHIACICDKDAFVAYSGVASKSFKDKKISPELDKIIQEKKTVVANADQGDVLYILTQDESPPSRYNAQVITPIVNMGDPVGAIILLSREPGVIMGDVEVLISETTAGFLVGHLGQ
ncbi:MAG: stage V sporulation protein T [Clostridiales bacterium]|nr:stage V sporulation protein T [Clostridiales bacterium]